MAVVAHIPQPRYSEGEGKRVSLFRVTDVNDGDTVDVSKNFTRLDDAHVIVVTAPQDSVTIERIPDSPVLTFRGVSLRHDVCYVLCAGAASE